MRSARADRRARRLGKVMCGMRSGRGHAQSHALEEPTLRESFRQFGVLRGHGGVLLVGGDGIQTKTATSRTHERVRGVARVVRGLTHRGCAHVANPLQVFPASCGDPRAHKNAQAVLQNVSPQTQKVSLTGGTTQPATATLCRYLLLCSLWPTANAAILLHWDPCKL